MPVPKDWKPGGAYHVATNEPKSTKGHLLSGNGVPTHTVGNDGDFYIDQDSLTASFDIYGPKRNGAWPSKTSLKGE